MYYTLLVVAIQLHQPYTYVDESSGNVTNMLFIEALGEFEQALSVHVTLQNYDFSGKP